MPCVEIADSIVQTGRETLEKVDTLRDRGPQLTPALQAIKQIEMNAAWKADVSQVSELEAYLLNARAGCLW